MSSSGDHHTTRSQYGNSDRSQNPSQSLALVRLKRDDDESEVSDAGSELVIEKPSNETRHKTSYMPNGSQHSSQDRYYQESGDSLREPSQRARYHEIADRRTGGVVYDEEYIRSNYGYVDAPKTDKRYCAANTRHRLFKLG